MNRWNSDVRLLATSLLLLLLMGHAIAQPPELKIRDYQDLMERHSDSLRHQRTLQWLSEAERGLSGRVLFESLAWNDPNEFGGYGFEAADRYDVAWSTELGPLAKEYFSDILTAAAADTVYFKNRCLFRPRYRILIADGEPPVEILIAETCYIWRWRKGSQTLRRVLSESLILELEDFIAWLDQ